MRIWREDLEKDMLAKGLKRSDAQNRAAWKLSCKSGPAPLLLGKKIRVPGRRRYLSTLLEEMDDDFGSFQLNFVKHERYCTYRTPENS